jgi:hypothetical protein
VLNFSAGVELTGRHRAIGASHGITGKVCRTRFFSRNTTTTIREPCQIRRERGLISAFASTLNRNTASRADDKFDEAVD